MAGRNRNAFVGAVFSALVLSVLATPAQAQLAAESDAPIEITGERFDAFQEEDYAIWTGDVHVVQGTTILTAPKLTMYGVADGALEEIHAEGGIRYTNGAEAISSDKAVYNASKETVIFTGNVVVVQGEQVLSGGRLIYYTQTGRIEFTSKKAGRVRGIFVNDGSSPNS